MTCTNHHVIPRVVSFTTPSEATGRRLFSFRAYPRAAVAMPLQIDAPAPQSISATFPSLLPSTNSTPLFSGLIAQPVSMAIAEILESPSFELKNHHVRPMANSWVNWGAADMPLLSSPLSFVFATGSSPDLALTPFVLLFSALLFLAATAVLSRQLWKRVCARAASHSAHASSANHNAYQRVLALQLATKHDEQQAEGSLRASGVDLSAIEVFSTGAARALATPLDPRRSSRRLDSSDVGDSLAGNSLAPVVCDNASGAFMISLPAALVQQGSQQGSHRRVEAAVSTALRPLHTITPRSTVAPSEVASTDMLCGRLSHADWRSVQFGGGSGGSASKAPLTLSRRVREQRKVELERLRTHQARPSRRLLGDSRDAQRTLGVSTAAALSQRVPVPLSVEAQKSLVCFPDAAVLGLPAVLCSQDAATDMHHDACVSLVGGPISPPDVNSVIPPPTIPKLSLVERARNDGSAGCGVPMAALPAMSPTELSVSPLHSVSSHLRAMLAQRATLLGVAPVSPSDVCAPARSIDVGKCRDDARAGPVDHCGPFSWDFFPPSLSRAMLQGLARMLHHGVPSAAVTNKLQRDGVADAADVIALLAQHLRAVLAYDATESSAGETVVAPLQPIAAMLQARMGALAGRPPLSPQDLLRPEKGLAPSPAVGFRRLQAGGACPTPGTLESGTGREPICSTPRKSSVFGAKRATQVQIAFSRVKAPLVSVRDCLVAMGSSTPVPLLSIDVLDIIGEQLAPQAGDLAALAPYAGCYDLLVEVRFYARASHAGFYDVALDLLLCRRTVLWQCLQTSHASLTVPEPWHCGRRSRVAAVKCALRQACSWTSLPFSMLAVVYHAL